MSQYNYGAYGEQDQDQGQQGVGAGAPPAQAPAASSRSRRRMYPTQPVDYSQPQVATPPGGVGAPGGMMAPGYGGAPDMYGQPMQGAGGYGAAPGTTGSPAPGYPGAGSPGVASPQAYPGAPGYDPSQQLQQQQQQQQPGAGQNYFTPGGTGAPAAYGAPVGAGGPAPSNYGGAPGYGVDQMAGQFGQMGINRAPSAGALAPKLPPNQLYNIDLIQNFPPPVSDLQLPPPPLVVPPELSLTGNPDANASSDFIRSTLNCVPVSNGLLKKSKLPFSLIVRPYTSLLNTTAPVPVVGEATICRCRRCRSYINCFVTFAEQTHRWKCNLCGLTNEIPAQFDWDPIKNVRKDRFERAELNYGVVEFIAPPEYLVRAPQPPVYVFLLDVSVNAITSGLLATAARAIQDSLDRLPNVDGRTKVAFMAVDSAIHFFSIPAPENQPSTEEQNGDATQDNTEWPEPSMMVVTDLEDPFLPLPSTLLVNLNECRGSIDSLLNNMADMFANNVNSGSAMASALKVAHKLIANIGGKLICLTASLPNVGHASLNVREDRKLLGTAKEYQLLQAANSFYKSFAVDCNRNQVTIDMFLFSSQYQDVATLSNLPRYTGGQTHFYPGWSASRPEDVTKFAHELGEHLSMEISMEAVLRVRASTGLRMSNFYGNFFSRSSDLCSFSTFPRDQSYVLEVSIEDTITKPYVYFQAAVLHTTCFGERRVRVINLALPTSSQLQDIYASADQLAIAAHYTHKVVEKALASGIPDAHDFLNARLNDMLQTYKKDLMTTNVGASAPLQFCANLRMLPLLFNALLKHVGLRKNVQIPSDLRSHALCLLTTLPVKYLIKYIHPDFYSLHDMPEDAGTIDEATGKVILPPRMNLSSEKIVTHGLYLIDDGQVIFVWVGRDAVPQLLLDAFGVESLSQLAPGKHEIPEIDSPLNHKIRNIVANSRDNADSVYWPSLYIIKEDGEPSLRLWASTFLIEDRTDATPGYYQYLTMLRDKINN